jgi:hypothetical protein
MEALEGVRVLDMTHVQAMTGGRKQGPRVFERGCAEPIQHSGMDMEGKR